MKSRKSKTDWGPVAQWYDQLVGEAGSEFHREIVLPGVLRLLDPQPGQRILDVACGQGVLARLLAAKGAEVTGVDASKELIELAKTHNSSLPTAHGPVPTYSIADARELSFLPENDFTSAACILAIQNIHPIQPVFTGISRALIPQGRVVIVMMHPCFRSPRETSWGWDEQQKVQYRRVNRYLLPRKHPIVAHPGQKTGEYTWTFHKPIETYVKALRGANLLIDALEEWTSHKTSTSGPRAAAENVARKEIPLFLALRAVMVHP